MSKILVTGGAGFIGSHIVERLLEQGDQVVVLDNFSSGKRQNLPENNANLLTVIDGDVADLEAVHQAVEGVDGVFHQAALVSVQESIDDPVNSFNNNTLGTFNVFEAARVHKVSKIVYASSAAIYGQNEHIPLQENELPSPLSPYALDKRYAEELAGVYHHTYGIRSVGLRYFNVYGPRQSPDSDYSGVISIFLARMLAGEPVTIFGDGEQTRDFVYVKDVANANAMLMHAMKDEAAVYNCGTGLSISINELYMVIADILSVTTTPYHGQARSSEVRFSCADIRKIKAAVSWRPSVRLSEGLEQLKSHIEKEWPVG